MKRPWLLLALLTTPACGVATYAYQFDITDPGAHNLTRPGTRDTIEDADIHSEILVDPTSFQAILLDVTNRTDQQVMVQWQSVSIVGPDGTQTPLRPDSSQPPIEPGARTVARLVPFVLPSRGPAAAAYDNATFELVVPMLVRGSPREYRYHLRSRVTAL